MGQVRQGSGADGNEFIDVKDIWTEEAVTAFHLNALYKERLKLVAGIGVSMYFSWPQLKDQFVTKYGRQDVFMDPTYAQLLLGDLDITVGYFDYCYNPDVKNLGLYFFRTATYPGYTINSFDYARSKLLGFKYSHKLLEKSLNFDVLLTSEVAFYPTMDWNATLIGSYNIANAGLVDVGAGVQWAHLLSVYDDSYSSTQGSPTDPRASDNRFIDSTKNADGTVIYDTSYASFRATKVMGRIAISPLGLIDEGNEYFSRSDFKFYTEAEINGLKNYPDSTANRKPTRLGSDMWDRLMISFGVNIPTFKILDVFNLELAYIATDNFNDYYNIFIKNGLPFPTTPDSDQPLVLSKWKWSVYAKKTLFDNHFAITAQLARDHMRLPSAAYDKANLREMLVEQGDWWWSTKFSYYF
jgi:hypothetical protein